MKKGILALLLVALLTMPALAQDAATQKCDTESIKSAVDDLIANYLAVKKDATDATSALQAAQDLQDGVASLTAGCAGVTAEATPVVETVDNSQPTAGKWMLNWSNTKERFCPDGETSVISENRPITLRLEGDKIVLEDIFVWPTLEFTQDIDGNYFYRRNVTLNDGSTLSFEYKFSSITPTQIQGTSTSFYQNINCSLANDFTLVLSDAQIICMAGSEQGANLRSGPGTKFDRLGKLDAGKPADVSGQATGDDGFVWWKLADGGWVRSDVVQEAGDCESVPQATP